MAEFQTTILKRPSLARLVTDLQVLTKPADGQGGSPWRIVQIVNSPLEGIWLGIVEREVDGKGA